MDMYAKLIELDKRVEALEAGREPRAFANCPHTPNCFERIDEPGECDGFNEAIGYVEPEPTLEPGQSFDPEATQDDVRSAIESEPAPKPKRGRQ